MTRRELLALAGSSLTLTSMRLRAQMGGGGGGMGGGGMTTITSPPSSPFIIALPLPRTLTPVPSIDAVTGAEYDFYEITARAGTAEILPGYVTPIWGYEGTFPGPAIRARSERPVALRVHNALPENIVVHLHGGHIPVESDGHAMDYIVPGSWRDYWYPNHQGAAPLWYHDHAMDRTGPHVWKGLAGLYVLEDDTEAALPLPKHGCDIPLVIQDRYFNTDGTFAYPLTNHTIRHGVQGDVIVVNGAAQPYLDVGTRKYRFRILNGTNGRLLQLALSDGNPFVQIGSDGGLLEAPVTRSSLLISPGERLEVIVDFTKVKVGTRIVLKNTLGSGRTGDVMRFNVARRETDTTIVPTFVRPVPRIPSSEAVRTRRFTLGMTMDGMFTINGVSYDHMRVDADPALDTTEIWEFVNPMGMWHCMHAHAVMWQILDRNGVPPPPWEMGWKDTWYMPGNSVVRVIARFADYACDPMPMAHFSNYMIHCHILEHEDHGMMAQFKVMPTAGM
jgi:spore coat protein A